MPPERHIRIQRTHAARGFDLPPPFRLVSLREVGDAVAYARTHAAELGAGTLISVGRFDLAEFAVVLDPDWPCAAISALPALRPHPNEAARYPDPCYHAPKRLVHPARATGRTRQRLPIWAVRHSDRRRGRGRLTPVLRRGGVRAQACPWTRDLRRRR